MIVKRNGLWETERQIQKVRETKRKIDRDEARQKDKDTEKKWDRKTERNIEMER